MRILTTLDLVYLYILKFHTEIPPRSEIISYTQDMCSLLKEGWTSLDISNAIKTANKMPICDLMLVHKITNKNLLDPYKFYFHNQLRITSNVEVTMLKDEEGMIKDIVQVEDQEYFLEMRASYSLDDLIKYYIDILRVPADDIVIGRLKGGLQWFVDKYGIDLTLYIIDAYAVSMYEDGETAPINPMDINNKLKEAKMLLKSKRIVTQESGDDKFVPRKRVLNFRGRS